MTTRALARIAGGVATVTVLAVAGTVTWSLVHRPNLDAPPPLREGPMLGDMTGYVGQVDRSAQTVAISDDVSGVRSVSLVVTKDTSITVNGKPGGLDDLSKDMPVRVFYEVRGDVKYLTSLQIIPRDTQGAKEAPPSAETTPVAPPAVSPAPAVARASAPARPVTAATPRRSRPAHTSAGEPAPIVPPRAADTAPTDTDISDGTAAVDWLLRESRRR